MTTLKQTLIMLLGFTPVFCFGQYYSFEKRTSTYEELQSPIFENTTTWQGIGLSLAQPNPKMIFFGKEKPFTIGVGVRGHITAVMDSFAFAINAFNAGLTKHQNGSRMAYGIVPEGTDTLHVFEWKNMGLEGHPPTDYVNFQIRIHQYSRDIEFVYGPSKVTTDSAFQDLNGIVSGILWLTQNFTGVYEQVYLEGDPSNPDYVVNQNRRSLAETPADGTVYYFTDSSASAPTPTNISMIESQTEEISVYPNPSAGSFFVDLGKVDPQVVSIQLFNTIGQPIDTDVIFTNSNRIQLTADLAPGLYFLELLFEEGQKREVKPITITP